jgi:hypothetical protein
MFVKVTDWHGDDVFVNVNNITSINNDDESRKNGAALWFVGEPESPLRVQESPDAVIATINATTHAANRRLAKVQASANIGH